MKRSELEVGQFVLVSRSNNWSDRTYDHLRVEVLDLGDWYQQSTVGYWANPPRRAWTLANGRQVILTRVDRAGPGRTVNAFIGQPYKDGKPEGDPRVFPLRHARGDWDELQAQMAKADEARKAFQAEQARKDSARAARVQAIVDGFDRHGVTSTSTSSPTRVSMTFEDAESVLHRLDLAERGRS